MIRILIPTYIPSVYSKRIEKAADLANSAEVDVHLLYIFDESMKPSTTLMGAIRDRLERSDLNELNIQGMADRFFSESTKVIGTDVKTTMTKGKPIDEIPRYVKEHKIDIIIMPYDKTSGELHNKLPRDVAIYQIKGEEILKEVKIVNREGERIVRTEEVDILNARYDVGEEVLFLPIISAETREYERGEVKPIKVHTLIIPPHYYAVQSFYARHGLGHPIAMGGSEVRRIEDGREVDYVSFLAVIGGTVEENDLIGAIALFPFRRMD